MMLHLQLRALSRAPISAMPRPAAGRRTDDWICAGLQLGTRTLTLEGVRQVGNGSMVGFVNMTLRNSASRHISKPDWQTRYQIQGLGCWPSVIVQPGASVRPCQRDPMGGRRPGTGLHVHSHNTSRKRARSRDQYLGL